MDNYCKTCCHDDGDIGFCDNCYYNHILEEKGIPPTEYEAKPKPITNADRIRKMSDEELAHFLDRWALGDIDYSKTFCDMCEGQFDCDDCRLWWLKKEADS